MRLVGLQEAAVELAAERRGVPRTPVQEADLEDAIVERLDELGVAGGYDLAPVYVGAGLDVGWLDEVVAQVGDDPLDGALRWLAYTLETESLMDEVEDATGRISTLVAAVKQYSYVDSSSVQEVDVHVGLDSTTVMLGHKLQGVAVVREYDRELPKVPAYAAELNQVWTNLIDNAADATGGTGRLVLRTRRDGDDLLVDVADDGAGHPRGRPAARLRGVLHHQAGRRGQRARARQRPADRRAPPPRPADLHDRAGRHDVHRPAAPAAGAAVAAGQRSVSRSASIAV